MWPSPRRKKSRVTERTPIETSRRIGALPNLPLFHKLEGRKAVVIGTSEGADWKAELLAAAGTEVVRIRDGWTPADLASAAIAIADLADREDALRFTAAARAAGAVVNLIDQPELSDVQFGTIVNRAPVVIAISTDGAAPMLGQSIRARIESVLPLGLSRWATAAKGWRGLLKQRVTDFAARRAFWERFTKLAWQEPDRAPRETDFAALLAGAPEAKGRVTLVGAGPGDPELLTLKAVRALQSATVILHDQLIGPEVLELARREARRFAVGKSGNGPSCKQADINALMVELALAGENVVRLKGGDPMIFGRATEEIDACRAARIEVSVIPGISAAQGAASSLLLSLTERRYARRVQFVTGHGADGKLPDDIDWLSVVDQKVTTVVYMPRHTLAQFTRNALRKGLDPATPAIAIASATLAGETHVAGNVAEIGALAAELPAGAPVAVLIGWVCRSYIESEVSLIRSPAAVAAAGAK
jgi:uroporphyrin-III C-methyltransferase/precorrin-2 dehydrogenase/sirohydrochlorin ferrochelatase